MSKVMTVVTLLEMTAEANVMTFVTLLEKLAGAKVMTFATFAGGCRKTVLPGVTFSPFASRTAVLV